MRLYILAAVLALSTACHKEAALQPDPQSPMYTLPQGNQPYDDSIVAFHQQYDSYILYKFTQYDFAYNYIDRRTDSAYVADTAYIPQALQFLKQQLFHFYPESFLQKTMPFKILLASRISGGGKPSATGFAATGSMLAFGYVNSSLPTATPTQLKQMRGWAHRNYTERAYRVAAIAIPDAFMSSMPNYRALNDGNKYRFGVVENIGDGTQISVATDFLGFIEMITSHTYAQLTAPGGTLSPGVDVNGMVMKRYNMILSYYSSQYGIDLQAIGDAP